MINQYENLSYLSPFSGKTIPLKELCLSITDCPHSTPKWSEEGMIVIRNFNIKNGELDLSSPSYTDRGSYLERNKRATPEPGDIIITREAPMGEVCMIPDGVECCLGQRMVLLKVDEQKVSNQYLLFALQSEFVQKQISKSDRTGSTVSNLCIPDLKEIEVPIFENSKAIADVLKVITSKIRVNNLINSELEAMAKMLYDYWFVQFDFPDVNGKPYKASGGKMIYNETLKREIPEGWGDLFLGDLINLERGVTYGKEDVTDKENPKAVGVLRATNVTGNIVDIDDLVYVPTSLVNDAQTIKAFETIIVMSSGSKDHVGKNGVYYFEEPLGFGAFCSKIAPKKGKEALVNTFLQSTWFRAYIKNQCLGTNINNLTGDHINKCPIVVPSTTLLEKFEGQVGKIYKKIALNANESQKLRMLRDWLLPMLMNGQVTVQSSTEVQEAQHG